MIMGCGCSQSSTLKISRKVADISVSNEVLEKRGQARARSVASTISTALGLDKTSIKMPLTEREKHTLMRTWEHMHHHIVEHGVTMFIKMFETSPQVKSVFEKFNRGENSSDLYNSDVLKIHGLSVMSAIDDIIANFDDKDVALELIINQGQSHAFFGFQDDMAADIFWAIEAPFLHAVKETLHGQYGEKVSKIYEKTIRFILNSFVQAFKAGKAQKALLEKNQNDKRLSVATAFSSSVSRHSSIAAVY
uniref:Globin gb_IID n=1 Tax=Platynereis dumerilii TaxID=6359 RepID=A0A7T8HUL8_PLADU|nr:globin gb_IID [Platynereis dumerilii]